MAQGPPSIADHSGDVVADEVENDVANVLVQLR